MSQVEVFGVPLRMICSPAVPEGCAVLVDVHADGRVSAAVMTPNYVANADRLYREMLARMSVPARLFVVAEHSTEG